MNTPCVHKAADISSGLAVTKLFVQEKFNQVNLKHKENNRARLSSEKRLR